MRATLKTKRNTALKLLLAAAFGLSFLLAVVAGTGFAVWSKPELVLHEKNVKRALSRFVPGFSVSWSTFALSFEPAGRLAKRARLKMTGLCVKESEFLDTCLSNLELDLSFSLEGFSPRITQLHKVVAHAEHLRLLSERVPKDQEPAASPLPDLRVPDFASLFPSEQKIPALEVVELNLEGLRIGTRGEAPLEGAARIQKLGEENGELLLSVVGRALKGRDFDLSADLSLRARPGFAALKGMLNGSASGWNISTPLQGTWDENLRATLSPRLQKGAQRHSGSIELSASTQAIYIKAGSLALPELIAGRSVKAELCNLSSKLDRKHGYPSEIELRCSFVATSSSKRALVKTVKADLQAASSLKVAGKSIHADFTLDGRARHELFEADIDGKGRLEFSGDWRFERVSKPGFHAKVKVPKFESLSQALAGSRLEIPAPFHSLQGAINLDAALEKSKGSELPFRVKVSSDLSGAAQSLRTRSDALVVVRDAFSENRKIEIEGEARLTDVALEAPPLRLEEPPQAVLDKRFRTSVEKIEQQKEAVLAAGKKSNLSWKLHIVSEQPVRVRTNLLETAIPLAIDLRLSDSGKPAGSVTVLPMPIEVFRKKAEVERVRLTFREGYSTTDVDGLLLYRNSEVLVRILILGTTQEPRVVFESDPPLNQQQIVSLLLFNKSVQELNEDEASSSASMSQALADGAFGLFSLMFLSSTPVESVGYDPVTDTYSVRVKLGNKTTISVASSTQGDRQYAVRRRIGKRWALRTELQRNEDRGNTALLTLLEWFQRF